MKQPKQFIIFSLLILLLCRLAQASVIDTVLTFDANTATSWTPVDFNGDGTSDISFFSATLVQSLGPLNTNVLTSTYLHVVGNTNNQVLAYDDGQSNSVLPLNSGTTISLTPALGFWTAAGYGGIDGPHTWNKPFESSDVSGVGAPGFGEYMGVRFQIGSDWHYGWVRFGPIPSSQSPFPSTLEFAYETLPNTPIITSVPEPNSSLLLGMAFGMFAVGKKVLRRKQLML